jgi:N utilization substance protein B
MQTVFEVLSREGRDAETALKRNVSELGGHTAVDGVFSALLVDGILKERTSIQNAIQTNAPEWPWERMDAMTRCILLIGAYELLFCKDVPKAVVMNEAIDIAKEYGTAESAKFVNGVLNALAHTEKMS